MAEVPMKVVYDGQAFSFQDFGGISRYFSELYSSFSKSTDLTPELIIRYSNNRHLKDIGSVHTHPFVSSYRFKGRNEIIRFLNRQYFKRQFSREDGPVIVHPTYYHPYFLEYIGPTPFVLTIHDMAHECFPGMFSRFDHTSKHKAILAPLAKRIIAVSEHTKKDIVERLGIPESRIDVIPHATTLAVTSHVHPTVALPDEYILYVGKRNTYKNFAVVLQALQTLREQRKVCVLVCAGGGPFTQSERGMMERLGLRGAALQLNASDPLMAYLYSRAAAFVYPSLYEGFGIPVLEAFACGSPAVLSNSSSLPEVGGDAALYFDPTDHSGLANSLMRLIRETDLAQDLRSKGRERVKAFTWERTCQQTLQTYRKALA